MHRILVLSSIFPLKEIPSKIDENNIILKTNDALNQKFSKCNFIYGFPVLYIPFILSFLTPKWKGYYLLRKKKKTVSINFIINIFPVFRFSRFPLLNNLFMDFHFFLHKDIYRKFLKENKIELIHAHSVSSDGYLAYLMNKAFNIPYIITVRELKSGSKNTELLNNCREIICLNEVDRIQVRDKYNKESFLIPHGIKDEFFNHKSDFNTNNSLKLLVVTRLLPLKNIDKVIISLKNSGIDFSFDIYGDGIEFENLTNLISELNLQRNIKLKGKVSYEEVHTLYSKYDLFIMPSFPEALGRVYFESMANYTPVIACKNTGVDGYIENNINGFLIDENNIVNELTSILVEINQNRELLRSVSINSRMVSDKYKWDVVLQKLQNIYL